MPGYMFDTNIFNRILDGAVEIGRFRGEAHFYATHVQLDELKATSNVQRRQQLLAVFEEVAGNNQISTESFVLNVSCLNEAKLGNEKDDLFSRIKTELDKKNGSKPNNIQDVLIAETALKNGFTLVTHDSDLFFVATKFDAACANLYQVMIELNRQNAA
ncbi:MAG: hypothetical protein C3F08_02000 [Candidatus Methylomirabilota bacterium]|nr:MAG: hypothetical protein C3F08_02000 [candidate division NC10 bacterium]